MKGRIAWVVLPQRCGMMSVYAVLSEGLRQKGWDVIPVASGESMAVGGNASLPESAEIMALGSSIVRSCAAELAQWVTERRCEILLTGGELFAVAAIPSLPAATRVVAKCPNQSRHSYRLVTACLPRTDLILVETTRQYEDLTKGWRVAADKCALIPNGVDTNAFAPDPGRSLDGPLRLVYTGRLDEATKNVMLLPEILRRLSSKRVLFHLTVIGDGDDRTRLQRRIDDLGLTNRVKLIASTPRDKVPSFLQQAHVALIPSRLDGMAWALLESMACGCVPVVSRIHRTTDMVVKNGVNGLLCRVGDAGAFANAVHSLARDRALLREMSLSARKTIEVQFTVDRMIEAHDRVFTGLIERPCIHVRPVALREIAVPNLTGRSWRSFVPRSVRNSARTWAQRLGVTV